jgi:hypothetical protein
MEPEAWGWDGVGSAVNNNDTHRQQQPIQNFLHQELVELFDLPFARPK